MKTFPWKEFLQRHPILATVRDDKRLDALLGVEVSWERTFAKDEVVVRKGELATSVFIMGSGCPRSPSLARNERARNPAVAGCVNNPPFAHKCVSLRHFLRLACDVSALTEAA